MIQIIVFIEVLMTNNEFEPVDLSQLDYSVRVSKYSLQIYGYNMYVPTCMCLWPEDSDANLHVLGMPYI